MNDKYQVNRIKLTVAYDGTAYHGWQLQPNVLTIEGELNHALSALLGEKIAVIGASRTDSGVHALGNIAVFDTATPIPAEKISYALNRCLPADIRIQKSEAVRADFHPRHVESHKTYEYRLWNADFPSPTKRLYHYFTYRLLNPDKMQEAADYLVGEHDFVSFCAAGAAPLLLGESTVRRIYAANIYTSQGVESFIDRPAQPESSRNPTSSPLIRPAEIIITLTGNGFLYNMVRIIAGTLIEVGIGKYPPAFIKEIITARDRRKAGPTAPPQGLTLVKYEFPSD